MITHAEKILAEAAVEAAEAGGQKAEASQTISPASDDTATTTDDRALRRAGVNSPAPEVLPETRALELRALNATELAARFIRERNRSAARRFLLQAIASLNEAEIED